jgi:hypothetical protein
VSTYLDTLKAAITDTGDWSWWTSNLPDSFQLEFGRVQLWCPPTAPTKPPSSQVALRLIRPRSVVFLANGDQPDNWFEALQRDELRPFPPDRDSFTLTDHAEARRFVDGAAKTHRLPIEAASAGASDNCAVVAFLAGPVGFYGVADALEIYNLNGRLLPTDVEAANAKWWENWREYWRRKDGPEPMPYDWTCEITIPAAPE